MGSAIEGGVTRAVTSKGSGQQGEYCIDGRVGKSCVPSMEGGTR